MSADNGLFERKPSDLITQPEAARMIGKSVETVRRWRKSGRLRFWKGEGAIDPVLISKGEIWALAGLDHVTPTASTGLLNVKEGDPLILELRESRDYFRRRVEHLERELEKKRQLLVDKDRKIYELERAINPTGLVRGLLAAASHSSRKVADRLTLIRR